MKTTELFDTALCVELGRAAPGGLGRLKTPAAALTLAALCLILAACGKTPQVGASPGLVADAKAAEAPAKDSAAAEKATPEKTASDSADDADKKDGGAKDDEQDKKGGDEDKDKEGVKLTAEQIEKLGVTSEPAQAIQYRQESAGYGVVLDHQGIAQGVAELQVAQATAQFSRTSLERARKLHDTPGAMSADVEQTAEQKAAVDSAAVVLSTEKLSSTWGMKPPWKGNIHDPRVQALARGDTQLVRVTFPLGSSPGAPDQLYGGRVGAPRPEATASMHPVWLASADANIPGRSYFTLLPAGTLAEGERLQVWAPSGPATAGAVIPSAAVVLSGGSFWCYVEKTPGTYVRVAVDTSRPTSGGYVVTEDIKPGDKVVMTAASQLLAKETGSSEEPD